MVIICTLKQKEKLSRLILVISQIILNLDGEYEH